MKLVKSFSSKMPGWEGPAKAIQAALVLLDSATSPQPVDAPGHPSLSSASGKLLEGSRADTTPSTSASSPSRGDRGGSLGVKPKSSVSTESGYQVEESTSAFDPPKANASAGVKKRLPAGIAVFWPRMPCLQCGCPWWLGEDWDARSDPCFLKWSLKRAQLSMCKLNQS